MHHVLCHMCASCGTLDVVLTGALLKALLGLFLYDNPWGPKRGAVSEWP